MFYAQLDLSVLLHYLESDTIKCSKAALIICFVLVFSYFELWEAWMGFVVALVLPL
jgi:hypothetical protein